MPHTASESIIVFGAGPTGRAALHATRAEPNREVLAFADNARALQGGRIDGIPVIAPAAIPSYAPDRIVVASHRWEEIVPQLHGLGLRDDQIDIYAGAGTCSRPGAHAPAQSDRIHYACGQRVLEGWLNVDGFDESYPNGCVDLAQRRRIVRMDLTSPHPFADETFQWGYSEDFLEHLTQAQSIVFLCEAHRTLRTGGVLRLSFPGLAGVLRRHLRSGGYSGAATCVDEAYRRWYHEHFYTFDSLQLVASHIGFRDVQRCEYGHSRHPVLKQDSRPQQADLNLVVELTK